MLNTLPMPRKEDLNEWLQRYFIVAIVPAFRVEKEIQAVLRSMPIFVKRIIVVNDASPDQTGAVVARMAAGDSRIILLNHDANQGVGGAMVTGFRKALELADIAAPDAGSEAVGRAVSDP